MGLGGAGGGPVKTTDIPAEDCPLRLIKGDNSVIFATDTYPLTEQSARRII
jgi:hypothetical protein